MKDRPPLRQAIRVESFARGSPVNCTGRQFAYGPRKLHGSGALHGTRPGAHFPVRTTIKGRFSWLGALPVHGKLNANVLRLGEEAQGLVAALAAQAALFHAAE